MTVLGGLWGQGQFTLTWLPARRIETCQVSYQAVEHHDIVDFTPALLVLKAKAYEDESIPKVINWTASANFGSCRHTDTNTTDNETTPHPLSSQTGSIYCSTKPSQNRVVPNHCIPPAETTLMPQSTLLTRHHSIFPTPRCLRSPRQRKLRLLGPA